MSLAFLGRSAAKRLAHSVRPLCQLDQLRQFAVGPANAEDDDDIVLSSFRNSQSQYLKLMQGLENIAVPLTGDDAAVKKYATEVEALKRKVGMPDYEEVINAQMDYAMACTGDVKKFINHMFGELKLSGPMEAIGKEALAAVEAAEAASGRELDATNDKGWAMVTKAISEIQAKHGLTDEAKVREEAVFEMYKKHVDTLRETAVADVEKVKAADDGLADITLDLAAIKPKLV